MTCKCHAPLGSLSINSILISSRHPVKTLEHKCPTFLISMNKTTIRRPWLKHAAVFLEAFRTQDSKLTTFISHAKPLPKGRWSLSPICVWSTESQWTICSERSQETRLFLNDPKLQSQVRAPWSLTTMVSLGQIKLTICL